MSAFLLNFISENDFKTQVRETLGHYKDALEHIDLKKFNSNIIDPIKLTFDKYAFNKSFEEIIKFEIQRQRDKSNTNAIGYFHQDIFRFIANCERPMSGWDVIYRGKVDYFVELKNKHNTMNSSSSAKTFMRMQGKLLENSFCVCALVEVIAKHSSNVPWVVSIDGQKQLANERLRRISIDKFYELVTGDALAFKKLCEQLKITVAEIVGEGEFSLKGDSVISELTKINPDLENAIYQLAFSGYEGF